jgi:hypothetical protein
MQARSAALMFASVFMRSSMASDIATENRSAESDASDDDCSEVQSSPWL